MNKEFYALRYRCDDGIHHKGDIQYITQDVLYIGQTPECRCELPKHHDYADICYAVIVKDTEHKGWRIIRQNKDVRIYVNGMPLELVKNIGNNDRLSFDNTNLIFTLEKGEIPQNQYAKYHTPKWIWLSIAVMFILMSVIGLSVYENSRKTINIYSDAIESIYKIEADTLLVLSQRNDTLGIIPNDRAFVGTGFVTENGYFVTARHCVEFWLSMESELKQNFYEIESEIVRKAIEAEMDTTIRLVSVLKITSKDEEHVWRFTSDDFVMDKSRDNIYDYGDYEIGYVWRSIVSLFEKRDAELGDVAVMKWNYGKGNVALGEAKAYEAETELCSFGYPQNDGSQTAMFAVDEGKIYQQKETSEECFICTTGFDQGFSGGPVFDKKEKKVIGIVSRSSDNHTLIVPVSQIHSLINNIEAK